MYTYLDGQLVQAEEVKFVVNNSNNCIYAIFSDGTSAPLQVVNCRICVNSSYQNNISRMQFSNT